MDSSFAQIEPPVASGSTDTPKPCPHCGGERGYSVDFDAYFCLPCNQWLEPTCHDPECVHCASRPKRPIA